MQWFVPRRQRARFEPHLWHGQNQFSFYQAREGAYNMQPVPPPGDDDLLSMFEAPVG